MRIKSNFVTNSSSSSFVIAIKGDLTVKELAGQLMEKVKQFVKEEYVQENMDYEIPGFSKMSEEKQVEEVSASIAESVIMGASSGIKIDGWNVYGGECSSEDFRIPDSFIYDCGLENTETVKYKSFY